MTEPVSRLGSDAPARGPGWGVILTAASGAIPFVLAAVWALVSDPPMRLMLAQASLAYGAILIGFLGGVRWGAEVVRAPHQPSLPRLAAAATPTVIAWGVLFLASANLTLAGIAIVACGLGQLAWDVQAARSGMLPPWTAPVRVWLTAIVSVAVLAVVMLAQQR